MPVDFTKADLKVEEKIEIATVMQSILLNEIFSTEGWFAPRTIFHGGTALSLLHGSGRFSEDLDFMIGDDVVADLEATMRNAMERMQMSISYVYPESKIGIKGPGGKDVVKWDFEWTNPNKRGKVKVKAEFLARPEDVLKDYRTVKIVPAGPKGVAIRFSAAIHGPELISSWSDKMIAMAKRDDFKWRDIYDVWFLHGSIKSLRVDSPEMFIQSLESTAQIYSEPLSVIQEGLEKVIADGYLSDIDKYTENMSRWLSEDDWSRRKPTFEAHLLAARSEVNTAIRLISEHAPSVPQP